MLTGERIAGKNYMCPTTSLTQMIEACRDYIKKAGARHAVSNGNNCKAERNSMKLQRREVGLLNPQAYPPPGSNYF